MDKRIFGLLICMLLIFSGCEANEKPAVSDSFDTTESVSNDFMADNISADEDDGAIEDGHSSENSSEMNELTMDALISMWESGELEKDCASLTVEELPWISGLTVEDLTGSLTAYYYKDLEYNDRIYRLYVYYWKAETAEEYGKIPDSIDAVRFTETSSYDAILLYTSDSRYKTSDLTEFLAKSYSLDEYMAYKLPDGYTLGSFKADQDFWQGCLLEKEGLELQDSDSAPESWYAPGGIGFFNNSDTETLMFENGKLTDIFYLSNHMEQVCGPEALDGCSMQAMIAEYEFDLFTAADWEEYTQTHPDADISDSVSRYWYVFLGEPDMERGYVVMLNELYFSKEDAIELARSIEIK